MSKKFHKNPRKITKAKLEKLKASLKKLGDLGGIVHDLNSDEIISGNQRDTIIEIDKCEIELIKQFDEPDEQGTVAIGFVIWQEKRYSYRQVRWSPEWCDEANILANLAGGRWDWKVLFDEWQIPSLVELGFDTDMLKDAKIESSALANLLEEESKGIDPNDEWEGMPEFENEQKAARTLYVHFRTIADFESFCDLIEQDLTDKTKTIWYPKAERRDMKSLVFENES